MKPSPYLIYKGALTMSNWIAINTATGKHAIVNLDKVAYVKWGSGTLYLYAEIDGRPSAGKQLAYCDPDKEVYLKLMNIIAKGGD